MTDPFVILLFSAATLGCFHTAIGIDHSLPFVILGKTRSWSLKHTLFVTFVCGLGHVLSSVAIATVGLGLGIAGSKLSFVEETRGSWAAWLLVGFGLTYAAVAWWKNRRLSSPDMKDWRPGHDHGHLGGGHAEGLSLSTNKLMPSLFVIFLLGPCEALLPLLTASGMTLSLGQSLTVTVVFSAATLLSMLALVALGFLGASLEGLRTSLAKWERHSHALAGLALAASGASIQVLGI